MVLVVLVKKLETDLLLIGAGIVTSLPSLVCKRCKTASLCNDGIFPVFAPSLNLVLGIFLYNEPFTQAHIITFSLIWSGLAIFSINSFNEQKHA
ncbi:MAG: hypothetical protein CM1200mP30_23300 [Pseudomonadota bacterium]|nr:MAG: hypothetical protein CM1200mP30_23300 [Pseudomonadota bacterium]